MIKIILFGTFIVAILLFILLLISLVLLNNPDLLPRTVFGALTILYLGIVLFFLRRSRFELAAWLLLILYTSIAVIIISNWGINAPVGIIMVGFVILLSGVMLGSKYIIPFTSTLMLVLLAIFILDLTGIHKSNHTALLVEPSFGDIATYITIFGIFALIAWISENRMEQSLTKALAAETALEKEKHSLAQRLEEQLIIVRKSQQEEIMQLYRFAELGQLTTVILHEMANNLSVLALDIDDIHNENQASEAMTRTKESIRYLESMVVKVRRQLNKTDVAQRFNANDVITETVIELTAKANRSGVTINRSFYSKKFNLIGDPVRLSQILSILVNNSIDACLQNNALKEISINSKVVGKKLEISVIDYGVGIPEEIRKNLFEPLHSTKQNGLGIGLFIAKQITETHFKGRLSLNPSQERTEFIVQLPKR